VARKSSSTAVQEELYPVPGSRENVARDDDARSNEAAERSRRESFDDSRVLDLESEQESPFLRAQKRVAVRRGSLPRKTALSLRWIALALAILLLVGIASASLYRYGKHSWRFRVDSSDLIEVTGAQHVSHSQIMEVMGIDIGRNIFFVPLAQRQHQLEQIPWVESASVMRFVPNRLRIEIHERTPVAFARIGSHISLIDAGGNLMELTQGGKHAGVPGASGSGATGSKYSFPVISGMNGNEPLSTRAARMKSYNDLIQQLDFGGARYSQEISEVDLTDVEDVKVVTADPNGDVLVHLGSSNYLQRYRVYVTHVQAWRAQFDKLESVDLRYDGQIIVNPDLEGMARQPTLTPAAAKAALAAGVKNAAIVNYENYVPKPAPSAPAVKSQPAKPPAKAATKIMAKPAPKANLRASSKASARHIAPKPKAKPAATKSPAAAHVPAPASPASSASGASVNASAPHPAPMSGSSNAPTSASVVHANQTAVNATKPITTKLASTSSAPVTPAPTNSAPSTSTSVSQKKPSPVLRKETPQN
jgi:cell division protein FtsQ